MPGFARKSTFLLLGIGGLCTLLFVLWATSESTSSRAPPMNRVMANALLKSVDFEVFGRVQGVFFRKHTVQQAVALQLVGHCRNTRQNTVAGTMQGSEENLNTMRHWLETTGSPHSRIDRVEYKNEREIDILQFKKFEVRH